MPSKLEQLKKEIQRVRPDIMELNVGCKTEYGTISKVDGIYLRLDGTDRFISVGQVNRGVVKILGRPITLEDVLFCCVEAYSKFGIITKKSYEEMLGGVVGLWDFTKDFDNQSEEFYDEIMFLLEK